MTVFDKRCEDYNQGKEDANRQWREKLKEIETNLCSWADEFFKLRPQRERDFVKNKIKEVFEGV